MQDHLHVGRMTRKRQLRQVLLIISPLLFMTIFGFPCAREYTTSRDGKSVVNYMAFFGSDKNYEFREGDHPPLFILVPAWWPHKNTAGMKWVAAPVAESH